MKEQERDWVERTRAGDEEAFREMFQAYFPKLCGFAADYIDSVDQARDLVQDIFLKIWDRRENWTVRTSLRSYLYQAVKNRALNEIRRTTSEQEAEDFLEYTEPTSDSRTAADTFHMEALSENIESAISQLPDRRRRAFLLHRRHGFTYKEIAQIMDISPKTVENHIGRALKSLRKQLVDQFPRELE